MLTCMFVCVRGTDREKEKREDSAGVKCHSNIHIHNC